MNERPIEWRIDAAVSRPIRFVFYGWVGLLGGGAILLIGLGAIFAIGSALSGEFVHLALFVLFALVGGPASLLYLLPAIRSEYRPSLSTLVVDVADDPEDALADRYAAVFSWKRLVTAVALGVLAIVVLFAIDPRLVFAGVAAWFALLLGTAGFVCWGRIDPETHEFEYNTGSIPLEGVDRVRRLRFGSLVGCWISYRSGVRDTSTPSWVVMPADAAETFDHLLDTVDPADRKAGSRNRAVTIVAVGIGLGFFAVAGGIWFVDGIDPGVAAYFSVVIGLFGAFFCWAGIAFT